MASKPGGTLRRQQRRPIQAVVAEGVIDKTRRSLWGLFRSVQRSVQPPQTPAEAERRERALNDGLSYALFGCVTYLRERDRSACDAILNAALRYSEELIKLGHAEWQVRRERKPPMWWIGFVYVLALHEENVRRLRQNWRQAPRPVQLQKSYGRMGEKQRHGLARTAAARAGRRDTVLQIMSELCSKGMDHVAVPSDAEASRWARSYRTPAQLSKKMLAYVLKRTPRQVEALLNDARKRNAKNLADHAAWAAWEQRERMQRAEHAVVLPPALL